MLSLSVIMPVYNECKTVGEMVARVLDQPEASEVIMVDDGSSDDTWQVMQKIAASESRVKIFQHPKNRGKGAALRTGIEQATCDLVIIQEADKEYDPKEYPRLLQPISDGHADVVYGSRFIGSEAHRVLYFWHSVGNSVLTLLSNMFSNLNLTDMETCFKVFKREIIQSIDIEEKRFGFEPEITAKLAKMRPQLSIYEISIGYYGRTYEEGKKIGWVDGVRAIWCIFKYNLFR